MSDYESLKQQAAAVRKSFTSERKRIENDKDLTPDARSRRINELQAAASDEMRALRVKADTARSESIERHRRTLFGPGATPVSDYRQVLAMTRGAKPDTLRAMLHESNLTGDDALGRAVALRAFESGHSDVLQDWAAANDDRQTVLTALRRETAALSDKQAQFEHSVNFSAPRS